MRRKKHFLPEKPSEFEGASCLYTAEDVDAWARRLRSVSIRRNSSSAGLGEFAAFLAAVSRRFDCLLQTVGEEEIGARVLHSWPRSSFLQSRVSSKPSAPDRSLRPPATRCAWRSFSEVSRISRSAVARSKLAKVRVRVTVRASGRTLRSISKRRKGGRIASLSRKRGKSEH